LTIGGELNKLAHNYSLGRDMGGSTGGATPRAATSWARAGDPLPARGAPHLSEPFHGFTLTRFKRREDHDLRRARGLNKPAHLA